MSDENDWPTRGKSVRQLIKELLTTENIDVEVRISLDGGDTHKPVGLVGRVDGKLVLMSFEDVPATPASTSKRAPS